MNGTERMASVFLLCVLVAACDQPHNNAMLEGRLAKAESQVLKLQHEVGDLKEKREWDAVLQGWDKVAYLTPGAEGYSTVGFDLGVLTVQLTDVRPYANGSKVTLRFGNTLFSSIDGLKATIEWGEVNDKGVPDNTTVKSKDMTFAQSVRGGAWTPISVVLDGLPPAELGFVRVSKVSHTGIRLLK